ncbi:hypothetical protein CCMSSC00406_0008176 [Pleurotus cornucopiae]|uniref:Uncharacterized protein n=1 Tax=Pleurotus cornucopiae TaxID=5321 RepID=A0ACB7IPV4_PLECO|nr:hypothetical protein CCMSSC00406_0008176 [Pleurotus cornucopiae]
MQALECRLDIISCPERLSFKYSNLSQTTPDNETTSVKRICVIGAGAGGLAALKAIVEAPQHKAGEWKVTAFEARNEVGGIWLPAPPTDDPPLTPLYDSLTTNLPHPVMAFTCFPFPPSTAMYPSASVVEKYLASYAEHFGLMEHIQLNTAVTNIARNPANTGWTVTLSTGEDSNYDLVIVANGHYRVPRYPNTPGLDLWLNAHKAKHSAWYRHPLDLGAKVLVVGDGPSARDISAEMSTSSTTKALVRSVPNAPNTEIANIKTRGRIISYCADLSKVIFEDGSTEEGIDFVILATGYELSFPFLSPEILKPGLAPPVPPLPRDTYNSTYNVFPLAKHIFPLQSRYPPSSLAFICLLMRVVPFPLMEAQARVIVHAFANPDAIDDTEEAVDIITHYEDLRRETGDIDADAMSEKISKMWHVCRGDKQFSYRDELHRFAERDGLGVVVVPDWIKEAYEKKEVLRELWVDLVSKGEADDWVRGVGEKGEHEWVDVLRRMIQYAENREKRLAGKEENNIVGDIAKL